MEVDDPLNVNNSKAVQLSIATIKAKILTGEFKIVNKTGSKSKVWELFGLIEDECGEEIEDLVYCRGCSSVFKYHCKITSNLCKHKCYAVTKMKQDSVAVKIEVDSIEVKKNVVRVVTKWIIDNCRSFEIIEDSGLKSLAELLVSLGARYGENFGVEQLLPAAATISRNVEESYGIYFAQIKDEINLIKDIGFGLTSALWTDNYLRTTYISLTMHYIHEGQLIHKLLGVKSVEGESRSAENMEMKIRHLLYDFNCELDNKATIVTDRGTIMEAALRTCHHIYCINHLLYDAVEKSTKEVPAIVDLEIMCTELVQYLLEVGIDPTLETTLKRWNTIYYLFDTISKNWDEISNILEYNNEPEKIKNINLNHITALVQLLQSFEETSRTLAADNNVTLHLVYVHVHRLKKNCVINTGDLKIVKHLKEKLNLYLESQVLPNITVYHKMALFLFPPANKLIPFSESDQKLVKDECKRIMLSYLGEVSDELKVEHITAPTLRVSANNADLFNDFVQSVEIRSTFSDDRVTSEIIMYQSTNVVFHDDFDLLNWWHMHKVEFPLLYKLSCQLLATPASCAASESIFSSARHLIAENKLSIGLEPNGINQIMFLHSNISKNNNSFELEGNILMN